MPVRTMVWTAVRALGTTAALVAIYYLLPLDHTPTWIAATILATGLVALIALVVYQVRRIIRSRFPVLRAVEALGVGGAIAFLGIAVGWWLIYFAAPIILIGLFGWVFEYYRGENRTQ